MEYDTLIHRVSVLARLQPEKTAVIYKKETLTCRGLWERIQSTGSMLASMGVAAGDRVVFTAVSKPETIVAYLGIQYCGGVAVPIDKNGTAQSIADIYKIVQAKLLLTDKPMREYTQTCRVHSLRAVCEKTPEGQMESCRKPETKELVESCWKPEAEELAELLFTTGTTGEPKGVMLSYRAVYQILNNTIQGIGMREDDRILLPLPLNHSFALRVLRAALYLGATVILQNGFMFAKELEWNMEAFSCTALAAVPAAIETIRMQMQDRFASVLGRLRYIEVSAGALTQVQRENLVQQLPDTLIYNTWGSSETGGALFCNVTEAYGSLEPQRIKATGMPLPWIKVKTVDERGKDFISDPKHPGRMAVKGDMLMSGYWNREDLTRNILQDGWLLTGDLVFMDETGCVYMQGRADDLINAGGEKISPAEIEQAACLYPCVRTCVCIGQDDPDGICGQVPVLFVVPGNADFSESGLRQFLAEHLERYKLPRKYIVLDELPKNRMMKTDTGHLKELLKSKNLPERSNPVIQALLSRRSIRRFTGQPVEASRLDMILKAGYYAPSGHNLQSWRFTVLESPESIARLKEAAKTAADRKKVYFYGFENPAAVVLVSNDSRNPHGCQDASCAAENLMLAAWSYGIGSVWINVLRELRKEEPIKTLLDQYGVPGGHIVWAAVALGYPAAEGAFLAKNADVVKYIDRRFI